MTTAGQSLSAEMEDYLETIAALLHDHGEARVTDIAKSLSVRKPSVTQALRTLAERGFLRYEPYQSPVLTALGRKAAERVQHRHDVIKRFLVEVLLVDRELAESNACRLEHAVDKEVLDHLAHFVDFVQRCPRGGAKWIRGYEYFCDPEIEVEKCESCMQLMMDEYRNRRATAEPPQSQEPSKETREMTLAQVKPGQAGRIVRVGDVGSIRRRIVDMGVVGGTSFKVMKVAPLGDPIEVKIKGYSLTLRKDEAKAITVEL